MSEEVARRDVDHDDDEKGQWNRSIASLRSELWYKSPVPWVCRVYGFVLFMQFIHPR